MYHLQMHETFGGLTNYGRRKDGIETSSLGGLQKKSLEHNDCSIACSVHLVMEIQENPTDNILIPKIIFKHVVKVLFPMFLKSIKTLEQLL